MNTDKIKSNQINVKQKTEEKNKYTTTIQAKEKFEETKKNTYVDRSTDLKVSSLYIHTHKIQHQPTWISLYGLAIMIWKKQSAKEILQLLSWPPTLSLNLR